MTIDQAKLDRLKAFSVSATPGPWVFQPQAGKPGHGFLAQVFKGYGDEGSIVSVEATEDEGEATANAAFICAAREAIPALIGEIERLTRERDEQCALVAKYIIERDNAREDRQAVEGAA